jgi:predicted deacylase
MPLFAGTVDDGSPQGEVSVKAAAAFGSPTIWLHDEMNSGRSYSAAWARGIPAIYAESGGGGALRQSDLDAYVAGVLSVMAYLGMIGPALSAPRPERVIRGGNGLVVEVSVDGWVLPLVSEGAVVAVGEPLAEVLDADGARCGDLHAPAEGTVMMVRHRAAVHSGDMIAVIAPRSLPFGSPVS